MCKVVRNMKHYVEAARLVKTLSRFNCSAFTSCMVASGRIEGRVVTNGLGGPWDYAPGTLLIREAGGIVEHFGGAEYNFMDTSSYVAGTDAVVKMTRELAK